MKQNENTSATMSEIKSRHDEIMKIINKLIIMSENSFDEEQPRRIEEEVRHFGGYVLDTFKIEEKYMIVYKYHGYDSHKSEHMEFLKNYSSLKKLLQEEGDISVIIKATKNQAIEWFVEHMTHSDNDFTDFLKATGKK